MIATALLARSYTGADRQRCDHAALKADAVRWAALPLVGTQVVPDDDDEPGYLLAIKNCPHCHSSLAIEVRP